ncbi:MAG: exodeoxyribonuclease VII small subunit [Bacteroides sp.]|nr:exodeoxyribonuclease VII small subunit [Bacteroides sp.]
MAPRKKTYSQALEQLEKIVHQIDTNELEIDELSEPIREANEWIAFCTDKEIEKLLAEGQESEE